MHTMRDSMKKLLKKQFKDNRAEYLIAYDYVKSQSSEAVTDEMELYTMHCNIVDLRVLQAFLEAYIKKAQAEFEKAKQKDKEGHFVSLKEILEQCEELLDD